MAQPPLSRQVRMLEQELGVELFDRASRPIRLTAAGAAFLEEAHFLLNRTARAVERSRRTASGERGLLSVAALPWAYNGTLPAVIVAFRERAPDVRLELSTRVGTNLDDALAREWVVGFDRGPTEARALRTEPLLEEKMVAAVPGDHPLADRAELSFEELASESFISIARELVPGFDYQATEQFAQRGLQPRVVHEAPDPQAQLALVAAGVGVGLHLAPASCMRYRGVVFIPVEGATPIPPLALVWRRGDDREVVRLFLDSAREVTTSVQADLPQKLPRRREKSGAAPAPS